MIIILMIQKYRLFSNPSRKKKLIIGSPKMTEREPVIEKTKKTIISCFKL